MKPSRRQPIRLIAYFILCAVTWIVLQAEWARGELSVTDLVWILVLFLIFFLAIARLGRPRGGSEEGSPASPD